MKKISVFRKIMSIDRDVERMSTQRDMKNIDIDLFL